MPAPDWRAELAAEIERLEATDPIVSSAMGCARYGGHASREEALMLAVVHLARHLDATQQALAAARMAQGWVIKAEEAER